MTRPVLAALRPWPALLLVLWLGACAGDTGADGDAVDSVDDVAGDSAETADGQGDAQGDADTLDVAPADVGCTEGSACDDGDPCTVGETCTAGVCGGGDARDCDDGSVCTTDGCEATAGGCVHTAVATVPPLVCDDGDACTTGDHCVGGACLPTAATSCDDDNACTKDSCDAAGGCTHAPDAAKQGVADGCSDDDACTVGDACKDALCITGAAAECDDGNACTVDTCASASGCVHTAVAGLDVPCDDGDGCTLGDHCLGAFCLPTALTSCDDDNACTIDSCSDSGCSHALTDAAGKTPSCSDGDACTAGDACKEGVCVGAGKTCDDGNACTVDACATATGACSYTTASAPAGGTLSCDDGDACTGPDSCDGALCQPGKPTDCDDGNPCTDDGCVSGKGCQHTPNTLPCDDGSACTFLEACKDGTCAAGKTKVCVDGKPCTADGCDAKSGACTFTPLTAAAGAPAPCDDGDACTKDEACKDGTCTGGVAGGCDDGNACTFDVCDGNKGCQTVALGGACSDGNACTTGEACDGGSCKGAKAVDCDDGKSCTIDACVAGSGNCTHTPAVDGASCDDGQACTKGETCSGGTCAAGVFKSEVISRAMALTWTSTPVARLGDLDGDGVLDLVMLEVSDDRRQLPTLKFAKGKASGAFAEALTLGNWADATRCGVSAPKPILLLADVDADGDLDVIVGGITHAACAGGDKKAEAAYLVLNNAGTLAQPTPLHSHGVLGATEAWTHCVGLAWGRFGGAGTSQLALVSSTLSTAAGAKPTRTLRLLAFSTVGGNVLWTPWAQAPVSALTDLPAPDAANVQLTVTDLDGDGTDEMLVDEQSDKSGTIGLVLRKGSTAGTLQAEVSAATAGKLIQGQLLPGDFDADGDIDLLLSRRDNGSGGGLFSQPMTLYVNGGAADWWMQADITEAAYLSAPPGGEYAKHVLLGVADLDGDGRADAFGAVADASTEGARPAGWITAPGKTAAPTISPLVLDEAEIAGAAQLDGNGGLDVVMLGKKSGALVSLYRDGCTDGDACTLDACDPKTGCSASPIAAACDDGSACTTAGTCAAGVCKAGAAISCDDDNPCTTDSCDPKSGCKSVNNVNACNLNGCAGTCKAGSCTQNVSVDVCGNGVDDNCDGVVDETCTCGDGVVTDYLGEACDDGNTNDGDSCLSTCKKASCGDGYLYVGFEACDDGNTDNSDACLDNCVKAACGDGFLQKGVEDCDDGNTANGDGCSATCTLDNGVVDKDGDGSPSDKDCDDNDPNNTPGKTEVCDNKDNNCDGAVDESVAGTGDACAASGGVGECVPSGKKACQNGQMLCVADGGWLVAPKPEVCDQKDNDCNGSIDEGLATNTYFMDADGDGYGNSKQTAQGCAAPAGYVSQPGDCNDGNKNQYPFAPEVCNGIDDNCQFQIDEGADKTCDDGNACTTDVCQNGVCAFSAANGACDDGDACTDDDTCSNKVCKGTTKTCTSENPCLAGVCKAGTGCTTQPANDGAICFDGAGVCASGSCACGGSSCACPAGYWNDAIRCAPCGCLVSRSKPTATGFSSAQTLAKKPYPNANAVVERPDLAVDVDTVVLGQAWDATKAAAAGSVQLLRANDQAVYADAGTLYAPSPEAGGQFGHAVALHRGLLAVGARGQTSGSLGNAGAVHLFRRKGATFAFEATLLAKTPAANARCGASVAVHGDTVAFGCPGADLPAKASVGELHVYRRVGGNWTHVLQHTPADADAAAHVGGKGLVLTDQFVAASVEAYGGFSAAGTQAVAAVRNVDGAWTQTAATLLVGKTPPQNGEYGVDLAADGAMLAVGASKATRYSTDASIGAVDLYELGSDGTWTQRARIRPSAAQVSGHFGASVALAGDRLFVGAPHESTAEGAGDVSGRVYVYRRDADGAWQQQTTLGGLAVDNAREAGAIVRLSGAHAFVQRQRKGTPTPQFDVAVYNVDAYGCSSTGACTCNAGYAEKTCSGFANCDLDSPAGTPCTDTSACTSGDTCKSGACLPSGTIDCNDDEPCTLDSCDPKLGCKHTALANGANCSDGEPCTTGDACAAGVCKSSGTLATGASCGTTGTCTGLGTCRCADGSSLNTSAACATCTCGDGAERRFDGGTWTKFDPAPNKAPSAKGPVYAIATRGDRLIVGMPTANGYRGTISIFEGDGSGTWQPALEGQFASVIAPGSEPNFGSVVAIDAQVAAAGQPLSGKVEVYVRDGPGPNWSKTSAISAPVGAGNFGAALAVCNDWLYIGDPGDAAKGSAAGVVHRHTVSAAGAGGSTPFYASDAAAGRQFGSSIDCDGDYVAVAAGGNGVDGVYLFKQAVGGVTPITKILRPSAPDLTAGKFAWVALRSSTLLVGWEAVGGPVMYRPNSSGTWLPAGVLNLVPVSVTDGAMALAPDGRMAVLGLPGTQTGGTPTAIEVHRKVASGAYVRDHSVASSVAVPQNFQGAQVSTDGKDVFVAHRWTNDTVNQNLLPEVHVYRLRDSCDASGCVCLPGWQGAKCDQP